jgi:hypothetical protein
MGAALLHLGRSYLDSNELRASGLNWSDWLAACSSESVRIGAMHDGQVLVVHHVFRPDDRLHAMEVGPCCRLTRRLDGVDGWSLADVAPALAHHIVADGCGDPSERFRPDTPDIRARPRPSATALTIRADSGTCSAQQGRS